MTNPDPSIDPKPSRRAVLLALTAFASGNLARAARPRAVTDSIAQLEKKVGGKIGLATLDTANGHRLSYRADERFAMCSTFKLTLVAGVLSRVDRGSLRLDQPVPFTRSDLLPHTSTAQAHPEGGAEPLETLLQWAIETSDSTAANLLLQLMGGPSGYTQYLRTLGDSVTRLDRIELDLNSNTPGDVRDTTTPRAMLDDLQRVLLGDRLSSSSRNLLLGWMRNCRTGRERLRARLPQGWDAGDKTGTGANGAVNDLAIVFPPKRAPSLIACYLSGSAAPVAELNDVHAAIGALVAAAAMERWK